MVRKDLKEWVLSQEGDRWSVKFDVRDLVRGEGGIWTLLFVVGSSTLAARVRLVLSRLILFFALPLDFHGRVRVVRSTYVPAALHGIEASLLASEFRSMYIPAALHGIGASLLASEGLRKLRSSI